MVVIERRQRIRLFEVILTWIKIAPRHLHLLAQIAIYLHIVYKILTLRQNCKAG